MINDLREQKRTVIIEFEKVGYDYDLDEVLDRILGEIEIVCTQRQDVPENDIKVKITIK